MYDKYLPIGSIVLLKNGTKRLMITGLCVTDVRKNVVYDYSACLYPEGIICSNQVVLFNHSEINIVFALGYSDDEEKSFQQTLKENLNK